MNWPYIDVNFILFYKLCMLYCILALASCLWSTACINIKYYFTL